MSAEKTGRNGPSLPVPREEEEEAPAAGGEGAPAGASAKAGSVFGDAEVTAPPAAHIPSPCSRAPTPRPRWLARFATAFGEPDNLSLHELLCTLGCAARVPVYARLVDTVQ